MKNVLITGGCGFLGRHLVPELRAAFPDAHITLLDLVESCEEGVHPGVSVLSGRDIRDLEAIADDFRGMDTVIHCAGLVSFRQRAKEALYAVNVDGMKNVVAAAVRHGVERFVHVSSVAALGYKNRGTEPVDEAFEFDWDVARKRRKHYMLSKRQADLAVEAHRDGMATLTVYPGLLLGPGDRNNTVKFIDGIRTGLIPVNMPGGTNIVDVRDAARGLTALVSAEARGRYILSGHNVTYRELNRIIGHVVDVDPPARTLPAVLAPAAYYLALLMERFSEDSVLLADNVHSAVRFRYYDNSKARREVGWAPEIPLRRTIEDAYAWMTEHAIA